MQKIKSGDEVIVIAGKSKGQRGKVIRMDGNRVLVEGVAMVKRHTKPNPSAGVAEESWNAKRQFTDLT